MRRFTMACLAVFAAWTVSAQSTGGTIKTVSINGEGVSRAEAVSRGLENALFSICGMSVSISRNSLTQEETTNADSTLKDQFMRQLDAKAKGRIAGFDVVSVTEDPLTKRWNAQLVVRVYGDYIVGRNPAALRRMAVTSFISKQTTATLYGNTYQTQNLMDKLADQLTENLTQTRKFTMLDRKHDFEIDKELARLAADNASPADYGRLNQKLGTDYLVTGEVSFFTPPEPVVNPFTGLAQQPPTVPLMEVNYRVLLAPTGQLKWADTVTVESDIASGRSMDEVIAVLMRYTATQISDGMMKNILPFEIVGTAGGNTVVIGEGGRSLGVGEIMTVYAQGEMLTDTRTGESLGRVEIPVGTIKITRVMAKLSYAEVVSGDIAKMVKGSVVRRNEPPDGAAEQQPQQPATAPTAFGVTPQGGIVPPFK